MRRLVIRDVIVCVIILAAICLLSGCRAAKDRKAKNRVLTTPELLEQVGREWEKRNPCVNDTVFSYTAGDTLIVSDTITQVVFDSKTDTIQGEDKVRTVYKTITKTITIRDTLKIVVEDTRRLRLANDSANYYKGLYQRENAMNIQHNKDKKDLSTSAGWAFNALVRKWWFWLLILLAAGFLTRRLWAPKVPFLNR